MMSGRPFWSTLGKWLGRLLAELVTGSLPYLLVALIVIGWWYRIRWLAWGAGGVLAIWILGVVVYALYMCGVAAPLAIWRDWRNCTPREKAIGGLLAIFLVFLVIFIIVGSIYVWMNHHLL